MADLLGLLGLVRNGAAKVQTQIDANEKNELLTAQGLPFYTESARKGGGYGTMSTSAVAALVVRPTTTAAFEIFNGYSAGGKSLLADDPRLAELTKALRILIDGADNRAEQVEMIFSDTSPPPRR